MSEAVPLLKPDLVLVGVHQLDDLAQLYEQNILGDNKPSVAKLGFSGRVKNIVKGFLKASFSNYIKLFRKPSNQAIDIRASWEAESNSQINGFTKFQKIRFLTLSDTVQKLFKSGNINTNSLSYDLNFPDRLTVFNNPDNFATKFAIHEMNKEMKEMKGICQSVGAEMAFLNLPEHGFTGHFVEKTPSDVLNDYFKTHNNIDSIYNKVAKDNSLPYFELTEHFQQLQDKKKYFFRFDGHPNAEGYKEMGLEIGKYLLKNNLIKN
jgi:hypothetical protein